MSNILDAEFVYQAITFEELLVQVKHFAKSASEYVIDLEIKKIKTLLK